MAEQKDPYPVSIQITFDLPFALYSEGNYVADSGQGTVNVSLRRVRQSVLDARLGIAKGEFDLKGDRAGLVSYSSVTIQMQWATFDSIASGVNASTKEELIEGVAGYVANHVLESYRVATSTPWVRAVAGKELFNLGAEISRSDGVVEGIRIWRSGVGPITLPVTGLTSDAQQVFEQRLRSRDTPPIWDTLWLDSEDAVDRGDSRVGVVWGHSALETLAHATVLAWLRERNLDVAAAADSVGRDANEKGNLRRALSLEELVEFLNDPRKVEIALFDVLVIDPSWGYDRYARFEELAAARNGVLHSGGAITFADAQDHLQVVRAIRAELSQRDNLERIARSKPRQASAVLLELLGRQPHQRLSTLIGNHESAGVEVTFWSMRRHPLPRLRHSSGVSIMRDGKRLRIFLPPRTDLVPADDELELTRLLLKQVVIGEGWPVADVSERGPLGELSLGPLNWKGYAHVAATITDAVLGWEIERRLGEDGFDIRTRLKGEVDRIAKDIEDPTFREPRWGELDYFLLPAWIVAISLTDPSSANYLINRLQQKTPTLARTVQGIAQSIERCGWKTPQAAATSMLLIKSGLGILDTIGVREFPERRIRTRFRAHEKPAENDAESTVGPD